MKENGNASVMAADLQEKRRWTKGGLLRPRIRKELVSGWRDKRPGRLRGQIGSESSSHRENIGKSLRHCI